MIIAFSSSFPRKREPRGPLTALAALDPRLRGGDGIGARYKEPVIAKCNNEA